MDLYKKIVVNTFDNILKNSQELFQKLFIPTILICIINFFIPTIIQSTNFNIKEIELSSNEFSIPLLLTFLFIMINISIVITTHRVLILGSSSVPKLGSYILGGKEFKFLFKTILMGILIFIPVILLLFIPYLGIFIAIFIGILLSARLSFIFPAISCEEDISFYSSWKLTKGNTFLILFSIILFPLLFSISVGLMYSLLIEFLVKLISPYFNILYSFLNVFIAVFSISALSSAYLFIKPRPLNIKVENNVEPLRDIIEKNKKEFYKIIIHDKYKVTFHSLKNELEEQYKKLGFINIVYDRQNAFILKNNDNKESYVSLRYDNNDFTVQTNKTEKPILKILQDGSIK